MDNQMCKTWQSCRNQFTYQERIITITKGKISPSRKVKKERETSKPLPTHKQKCMLSERTGSLRPDSFRSLETSLQDLDSWV